MGFRLRFPESAIEKWATRYSYEGEREIVDHIAPTARERGWLTRPEFLRLCRWKSPRTQPWCARNDEEFIQEATRVALAAGNERLKIGILLALDGVSWPTASVILHFCDRAPYPILDFRALWSLSCPQPKQYTFALWSDYTSFVRLLHERTKLSMRMIDRALWAYSKEHQAT